MFFRRWQRTSSGVPRLCFAKDFGVPIPRPHIRQDTVSGQRPAAVRASGPDAIQCSRAEPPGSRRPRSGLRFCSAKGFGVIIPQPPQFCPMQNRMRYNEAEGFKRRTAPFLLLCKRLRGYYTTCQRKKQISAGRIHTFFTVYSRRYEPAGAGAYFSRKQLFPKGESP